MLNITQRIKRKHGDDSMAQMKNLFAVLERQQDKKYDKILATVNEIKEQNSSISSSI